MPQTKIYVGNLPYSTTNNDLEEHFKQYGEIADIKVISDRESGRSKGFGFITYETLEAAKQAVEKQDGKEFNGRTLRVNMANDDRRGGRTGGGGNRSHSGFREKERY